MNHIDLSHPYNAVMVDLETMGRDSNASIIAIGAVKFWLNVKQDEFTPDQLFHVIVDLESSQKAGLTIDADTVKWWLKQDKEAQAVLTGDSVSLASALNAFAAFMPNGALLFGNGATFDNIILRNAYLKSNIGYPVSYRNDMCYRTMARMSDVERPPFEGTRHNALHDSIMQTKHLMAILQKTPWQGI